MLANILFCIFRLGNWMVHADWEDPAMTDQEPWPRIDPELEEIMKRNWLELSFAEVSQLHPGLTFEKFVREFGEW